jgi:hypothetical protein
MRLAIAMLSIVIGVLGAVISCQAMLELAVEIIAGAILITHIHHALESSRIQGMTHRGSSLTLPNFQPNVVPTS